MVLSAQARRLAVAHAIFGLDSTFVVVKWKRSGAFAAKKRLRLLGAPSLLAALERVQQPDLQQCFCPAFVSAAPGSGRPRQMDCRWLHGGS